MLIRYRVIRKAEYDALTPIERSRIEEVSAVALVPDVGLVSVGLIVDSTPLDEVQISDKGYARRFISVGAVYFLNGHPVEEDEAISLAREVNAKVKAIHASDQSQDCSQPLSPRAATDSRELAEAHRAGGEGTAGASGSRAGE